MAKKFIDEVCIKVIAGNGGDGSASFRREKFIPKGGPDGGDGGKGGSVFLIGDSNLNTLINFSYKKQFKAQSGKNGLGQKKYGKSGQDLFLPVPLGSIIINEETLEIIGEILAKEQKILVAKGGMGGKGNVHFKSSTNRAPRQFTKGKLGETRQLKIELKMIADVGVIGLPNAGKSSLVSQLSQAKTKIASYPFTTLVPHLAKVELADFNSLIIADIPGIIKGASGGTGLGLNFLRHIARTEVLLHLVDISSVNKKTIFQAIKTISLELNNYSLELKNKKQFLVLNKIDLLSEKKQFAIKAYLQEKIAQNKGMFSAVEQNIFLISAKENIGSNELIKFIAKASKLKS